jgi:hypothetical protein
VAEDLGAEGVLKSKTACAAGGHCVAAGRPLGRKTGMPPELLGAFPSFKRRKPSMRPEGAAGRASGFAINRHSASNTGHAAERLTSAASTQPQRRLFGYRDVSKVRRERFLRNSVQLIVVLRHYSAVIEIRICRRNFLVETRTSVIGKYI